MEMNMAGATTDDQFQRELGGLREIELSAGRLLYRDHGEGQPVVFLIVDGAVRERAGQ